MTETPNNLPTLLHQRVAKAPDKHFLFSESDGRSFTYLEFENAVSRTAALLTSHGVGKGDVVSLLMPNGVEYIIAYFACWTLGALAGPVNSLLKEQEISYVISNSEAKTVMVHSEFRDSIETVRDGLPNLKSIITFDDYEQATNTVTSVPAETAALDQDDEAIIIYTSGTTGKPKGCLLTQGNLIANAKQISTWLGFTESDRLLTMMPLFHMNAVSVTTMSALFAGGSTVV